VRASFRLLFAIAALLGAFPSAVAASAPPCVSIDLGGVCLVADPLCPAAWYEPPFEDFSAGAQHCLRVTPTATGQDVCSSLRVGTYAKPTVREYDGTLCVSAYREGGVGCVIFAYEGNLLGVHGRPVCGLP
jgi:hypothetical protein